MKLRYNAHRVFHDAPQDEDYLSAITINETDRHRLMVARDEIRDALRTGLANWTSYVQQQVMFQPGYRVLANSLPKLTPKFWMQGSFSYRTINSPAKTPPQEIDLDDGVYLPTSFLAAKNGGQPVITSEGYFAAVEAILEPLCKAKGWELNKEKSSCVRVIITKGREHIDLPLYAIPDREFIEMMEKAHAFDALEAKADRQIRYPKADRVMLAHRKTGWEDSDPRKLGDWFKAALTIHGPVLRRVCRYVKGWRDYHWTKSPLSSIAIMQCVVTVFDELKGDIPANRDDFALMKVAERLPYLFGRTIDNPVIKGVVLNDNWTEPEQREIVTAANQLYSSLHSALMDAADTAQALSNIRSAFGGRVPTDYSLIRIDSAETRIVSYEPAKVAAPLVQRTRSG